MGRIRKDALDLEFLPEKSSVEFTGPKRIGCFSTYYDKEHKLVYRPDNSSQKYLISAELNEPIHCLDGFNPATDKCLLPNTWSDFFRWIRSNEQIMHGLNSHGDSSSSIDFICSNASLKLIMLSSYSNVDWIINAIKIRKTIFLFVSDEDVSKKRERQPDNDTHQNKMAYSRFKVIKKITKQVEECESDSKTEMDILTAVSFSEIGQHHMLHYGNYEFVMSKDDVVKPIDQAKLAALKLLKPSVKHNTDSYILSDLLKYRRIYWWASALLCGVETLICGKLDKDYTLHKLDVLPVSILNKKSKEQKKCLITLDKILDFIKSQVQESNKFYDVKFNKESGEVTASHSVSLTEDSVSPMLFS